MGHALFLPIYYIVVYRLLVCGLYDFELWSTHSYSAWQNICHAGVLKVSFLHHWGWCCDFSPLVCLCGILYLLTCVCWTNFASSGWNLLMIMIFLKCQCILFCGCRKIGIVMKSYSGDIEAKSGLAIHVWTLQAVS